MQEVIVGNRLIKVDLLEVLDRISSQLTNGKLAYYHLSGDNIQVCCPVHSDGHEKRPSCFINVSNEKLPIGWYHCFTCGQKGDFAKFVGKCFDKGIKFGEEWLLNNYSSDEAEEESLIIKEFKVADDKKKQDYLDESILNDFVDYHPYMTERKLTDEVIKKFEVKYDPQTKCLVFPVRDKFGHLKFLTRRSVESKKFIIDKGADKTDIYLLDEVIKENCSTVFVVESQINALTLWSWNLPAIALFGAGTPKDQVEQLNTTNILHYILCYDPDPAGYKGSSRFQEYIRDDVFVDVVKMPSGKDVNDMTEKEFHTLLQDNLVYLD